MNTTTVARNVRRRLVTALAAVAIALGVGAVAAPAATAAPSGWWTWDAPGWGWEKTRWEGVWYTSPYGQHLVPDNFHEFDDEHAAYGGGGGRLGYPTSGVRQQTWGPISAGGYWQTFERGTIYGSFEGTHTLLNGSGITQHFNRIGGGSSAVGYPAAPEVQEAPGWWYREFSNGYVFASRNGVHAVAGQLATEHKYQGGGSGLGYPTAPRRQDAPGFGYQTFERGVVYCTPYTQSRENCKTVRGGFLRLHAQYGGGTGRLGYPTGNQFYYSGDGSWNQSFERGFVEIFNNGRVRIS
ncbi:LGFP repeat-containing protein [Litorihabitans aurantiacus]|uniref:LGFP repeat-containing protein n=1 Tax=Litorihabitans aurantiacus TaxID=1930061 RepID=UPI0024E18375|nr:hypothetical protein [Litorihabitans aurantiacus]